MRMWLNKCLLVVIVVFFFVVVIIAWLSRPFPRGINDVDIYDLNNYIAHAGGGIDGHIYTNSKEALLLSLESGYTKVELDLFMTSDSNVVCLHSLADYIAMTNSIRDDIDSKSFKSAKLYGKYTPMTLEDAVKIWESKDFTLVLDKISDPKILNHYFVKNRQRIMVEAFSYQDYIDLQNDGYIPMLSFGANPKGIAFLLYSSFMSGFRIKNICVASERLKFLLRMLKRLGFIVAIWTKNDPGFYKEHLGVDVDLIYTDYWMLKKDVD